MCLTKIKHNRLQDDHVRGLMPDKNFTYTKYMYRQNLDSCWLMLRFFSIVIPFTNSFRQGWCKPGYARWLAIVRTLRSFIIKWTSMTSSMVQNAWRLAHTLAFWNPPPAHANHLSADTTVIFLTSIVRWLRSLEFCKTSKVAKTSTNDLFRSRYPIEAFPTSWLPKSVWCIDYL